MTTTEKPVEPELIFRLDDETGQLWAELQADENSLVLSASELGKRLKDSEYAEFFILESAIQELANLQTTSTEKIEIIVAERRHAEVSISIDDDAMQAFITITPAYGGEVVTEDQIHMTLRKLVIVEGILTDKIPQLVEAGKVDNELIAKGLEPVHGDDARLESLLPIIKSRRPKVNKDGTVNLRELGQFIVVKPDVSLMRKIPLGYGSSGANIYGQVVTPRKGEDIQLNVLSGTKLSPDDSDLLIADIAGQPILHEDGIEVDPTLSVDNVDLTTGNVDFDGSVYVNGHVISGMYIKTTGDIFIEGTVEASNLEAGGDITIKKGFIGRGSVRDEEGDYNPNVARAACGGRFIARFIENVVVTAGQEVVINDLISHCEVTAGENIIVGVDNGHGRIWGGKCETGHLFKANSIGTPADVKTIIVSGNIEGMKERFLKMGKEEKNKMAEMEKIRALIKKVNSADSKKQPIIDSVNKTLEINQAELNKLAEDKKSLIETYKNSFTASVVVDKDIFNGVHLYIADQKLDINEKKGPGTYSLEDKVITKK